jgi:hypothetical protein
MLQCTNASNVAENYDVDVQFDLSGKYSIQLSDCVTKKASRGEDIYPQRKTNLYGVKNNNYKYRLHPRLVNAIINRVNESVDLSVSNDVYKVEGYTQLTTISQDGNRVVYHANPHLQGRLWYDWA